MTRPSALTGFNDIEAMRKVLSIWEAKPNGEDAASAECLAELIEEREARFYWNVEEYCDFNS